MSNLPNSITQNNVEMPLGESIAPQGTHMGVFDVAETIQRLCNEGTLDLGLLPGPATNTTPTPDSADPVATVAATQETTSPQPAPNLDLLSKTFLQSVVNFIAMKSRRSIGVVVVSKTGRVVQSAHSGWDPSLVRTQQKTLARIARECILQPDMRISIEAFDPKSQPTTPDPSTQPPSEPSSEASSALPTAPEQTAPVPLPPIRGSVFVNDLAKALNSSLVLQPVPLDNSSGFAIFFCDANKSLDPAGYIAAAQQLWCDESTKGNIIRHIDAWLVVQRCDWYMRTLATVDWVLSRPRWWLTPIALFAGAMLVPVPYYPKRDCVFEPETKHYLASPVAGRIASCDVRPGDSVEKGQLLARLDDDQLRRDLATAKAEYDGALKKRDAALATRAAGNAGLADIEMQQAQRRIESIEDHLRRLEIRANAAGIVVQGDWHRNVGMPVTLGQNLFEVAELESMTAEVRLNATDLGQIRVGDVVSVRSDASGLASFHGKISRIEPRATVIENSAVFIADVVIRDPSLKLRPGMKASAQITAGWRTLGWLLFERPYRWIANQWIW
jgi:biotin carboxyl carrier protein